MHRRDAQRVLRADGRDHLQVRGHARQVHGRRHHGLLGRARSRTPTTPSAACSARSSRWRCSAGSTASASGEGKPPLAVGIGIHTGPLVAGYVGSSKALSYTVIGDTANTSARLCGDRRRAGRSSSARRRSRGSAAASSSRRFEPRSLKGKEKPLRIFNVLREKLGAVAKRKLIAEHVAGASHVLPFEKPVVELVARVRELRELARSDARSSPSSGASRTRPTKLARELFAELTPWQKVQLSRHPNRPYTLDYIDRLFDDFVRAARRPPLRRRRRDRRRASPGFRGRAVVVWATRRAAARRRT